MEVWVLSTGNVYEGGGVVALYANEQDARAAAYKAATEEQAERKSFGEKHNRLFDPSFKMTDEGGIYLIVVVHTYWQVDRMAVIGQG